MVRTVGKWIRRTIANARERRAMIHCVACSDPWMQTFFRMPRYRTQIALWLFVTAATD